MTDTRGPADWSAAYGWYLTHAGRRTARSLDLWYLVLQRVAQGQITPAGLGATWSATADRHAATHAAALTAHHARFFAGLAALAMGTPAPEPPADAGDPLAWFGPVGARAVDEQRRRVEALTEAAVRAASGGEVDLAALTEPRATPAALVGGIARLQFEWLDQLGEAGAVLEEQCLRAVLGAGRPGDAGAAAVRLEAPVGAGAATAFTIENSRADRTTVECLVGDVRRADGIGPGFAPAVAVRPARLELDARQQADVRLSLTLDGATYQPGAWYVGTLLVSRTGQVPVEVPLHIRATPQPNVHGGDAR